MKMVRAIATVVAFGIVSSIGITHAQTGSVSLQTELLQDWSALKDSMHKIAAEMPPDKYGFKPTEAQQTFGERAVHVASVNVGILGSFGGTTAKPTIDPKATAKDAAIKAMDDSFDYGTALLKQTTDQALLQQLIPGDFDGKGHVHESDPM